MGKHPFPPGLDMAYGVLRREKLLHPDVLPLLIVLTDGAGNVSMGHLPPLDEARWLAERIAEDEIHSVVINMEHAAFDQGLAQDLADHLKAPCYALSDLRAESLYYTVRQELNKNLTTSITRWIGSCTLIEQIKIYLPHPSMDVIMSTLGGRA